MTPEEYYILNELLRKRTSFSKDLLANISGNFITDTLKYLIKICRV